MDLPEELERIQESFGPRTVTLAPEPEVIENVEKIWEGLGISKSNLEISEPGVAYRSAYSLGMAGKSLSETLEAVLFALAALRKALGVDMKTEDAQGAAPYITLGRAVAAAVDAGRVEQTPELVISMPVQEDVTFFMNKRADRAILEARVKKLGERIQRTVARGGTVFLVSGLGDERDIIRRLKELGVDLKPYRQKVSVADPAAYRLTQGTMDAEALARHLSRVTGLADIQLNLVTDDPGRFVNLWRVALYNLLVVLTDGSAVRFTQTSLKKTLHAIRLAAFQA
jgi:hypothetical protein